MEQKNFQKYGNKIFRIIIKQKYLGLDAKCFNLKKKKAVLSGPCYN